MKKFILLLICLVSCLLLVGCDKSSDLSEDEIKALLPYDYLHYSLDGIDYDLSEHTDIEIELRKENDDLQELYVWILSDDGVVESKKRVHLTFKHWDEGGWQLDSIYETEESFSAEVPDSVMTEARSALQRWMDSCNDYLVCNNFDYNLSPIEEDIPFRPSEKHVRYIFDIFTESNYVRVDRSYEVDFRFHDTNGQQGGKNSYEWDFEITETGVNESWNLSGLSFEIPFDDYYLELDILEAYKDAAVVNALSASYYGTDDEIIHGVRDRAEAKRRVVNEDFIQTAYNNSWLIINDKTVYYWLHFGFGYESWDIIILPDKIMVRPAAYKLWDLSDFGTIYDNRIKPVSPEDIQIESQRYDSFSAESFHTVGLNPDGTVVATGRSAFGQCDVSGWRDIVAVDAGSGHTVGLKADGTVVSTKCVTEFCYGECSVGHWKDIVSVVAAYGYTVGLRSDGTVVATGRNDYGQCEVGNWRDIVAIFANYSQTFGLKSDGTVVATGRNDCGQCEVGNWRDIVSIDTAYYHTVGLRADGTVVVTGNIPEEEDFGQCDVGAWRDIMDISTSYYHTAGLRSDGTVVVVGFNEDERCNVSGWQDIVDIDTGFNFTAGLKFDGTVVALGSNYDGQCDVNNWSNILVLEK